MKTFALISGLLFCSCVEAQMNIDSLLFDGVDTTGMAKEMAAEEATWTWTDTLDRMDFSQVDNKVLAITKKYKSIPELAKDLAEMFPDEEDYVRGAFRWITNNIAYDMVEYHNKDKKVAVMKWRRHKTREDEIAFWQKAYFNYATKVLKKKRGICEGYSTLFYELCKTQGIKCKIIHGKAGTAFRGKVKMGNHAWNQVYVYGQWLYVDVTWAAGVGDEDAYEFLFSFNNHYYFSVHQFDDHIQNDIKTKNRNNLIGNHF